MPWQIQVLEHDIHSYFQLYNHVIVKHSLREGNHAANWLVKFWLSLHSTVVWNHVLHRYFHYILHEDNL